MHCHWFVQMSSHLHRSCSQISGFHVAERTSKGYLNSQLMGDSALISLVAWLQLNRGEKFHAKRRKGCFHLRFILYPMMLGGNSETEQSLVEMSASMVLTLFVTGLLTLRGWLHSRGKGARFFVAVAILVAWESQLPWKLARIGCTAGMTTIRYFHSTLGPTLFCQPHWQSLALPPFMESYAKKEMEEPLTYPPPWHRPCAF